MALRMSVHVRTVAFVLLGVAAWLAVAGTIVQPSQPSGEPRRMSLHNRILLNRAAVTGLRTIEVLLMAAPGRLPEVSAAVARAGGRIGRADATIDYLRVDVPIERLLDVVSHERVAAYQISSLSKASWYRDTPPRANAEMFRGFETTPAINEPAPPLDLPYLPVERSRDPGFTAEDLSLRTWKRDHPTFDGRGVTIAIVEGGQPELSHPTLRTALTLDGREVPKIAGILNAIDLSESDETRVELDTELRAPTTWQSIDGRTYIMPRPGHFRFGLFSVSGGGNVTHQFAVLRDVATGDTWVDASGNADFGDEQPIADVNERFDVRTLRLSHPGARDLGFVVSRGRAPHIVHIYVARADHEAMTVSVAAGSQTADGLASGVAPAARILLVRHAGASYRLRGIIEGFIDASGRPDVDLLSASTGIDLVPDTSHDFGAVFFDRLIARTGKPIFLSAGNMHQWLNSAVGFGNVFSVGGSIPPESYSAFYGGGTLGATMVHPSSAAGPSVDGALKPDFIAPVHRIAARLLSRPGGPVPRTAPAHQLPPGYQNSCCTSASAPYAAGIAALILSGLKHEQRSYTFERLSRALRIGARFLPDLPAFQQGNGEVDVQGAWREMTRMLEIPRIRSTTTVVHPLADYAANGPRGEGLFEWTGWRPGMSGRRVIELTRESGSTSLITYRVSWTGNDGTFAAPSSITLPLGTPTPLTVDISVRSAGAHGALLNLHDAATGDVLFRTQATIVAAEAIDATRHTVRFAGSVQLLRKVPHYLQVPGNVHAMRVDLEILRGAAGVNIVPGHSLFPAYQGEISPQPGRTFTKGRYTVLIPSPAPGTWTIDVNNTSTRRERDATLVSADDVEYAIGVELLRADVDMRARPATNASGGPPRADAIEIGLQNLGAALREPVLLTSFGTLTTHHAQLLPSGLPNLITIDVPSETDTLSLELQTDRQPGPQMEIHLYNCSSGECFSQNYTIPAAQHQRLVVRRPSAGRWVAAINAAPFPAAPGGFVLKETVTGQAERHGKSGSRAPGERWTETIEIDTARIAVKGATAVLRCEVVDAAAERDERRFVWEIRNDSRRYPSFPHSPVAAGTASLVVR
jgi:Subtilase family